MSMTRASTVAEEPPAPGIPEPEGDIRQPAPAQDVQPTYLQHPPGYFGGRRHSCSRCDAHSGLGDGFFGGPSPGPCSPGYHILPLQGSPRQHTTHPRMERGTARVAYIKGSVLTIDSWDLAQISPGTREPASAPTTSSLTLHECALLFVVPQITLGRLRLFCLAQAAR